MPKRGKLIAEYYPYCSCGEMDCGAAGITRKQTAEAARERGWKNTKLSGWKCPRCLEREGRSS